MRGLLLIDIQNDFLPGGALAVPRGDEVIAVASRLASSGEYGAIVATQDFHPADHGSFASQHAGRTPYSQGELAGLPQTLWPDHCVEGTRGAELADGIDRARLAAIVPKGTDRTIDSYSGFFDNARRKKTPLEDTLRGLGVTSLDVVGLATDYCVKATVLDALELGFPVRVHLDGIRAVDLAEGDGARAIRAMRVAGAEILRWSDPSGKERAANLAVSAWEEFCASGAVTKRCDACQGRLTVTELSPSAWAQDCACGKFSDTIRGI